MALTIPAEVGPAEPGDLISSAGLYRHLVWLYVLASGVAVVITFFLALLGLEFTFMQWVILLLSTPVGMAVYVMPDIYMIRRHYKPLGSVLSLIERDEQPAPEKMSLALVQALNLPFYSFLRVTFLHGPMAAGILALDMVGCNYLFDAGFQTWQLLIFIATIIFFAAPSHAIIEYFAISRDMTKPLGLLWRWAEMGILPEHRDRLVAIRLKTKLLYLSIFVATLPLFFFACSIMFKVSRLVEHLGFQPTWSVMMPMWLWVVGVVVVCIVGAIAMSTLTASEVSRSAGLLHDAMGRVTKSDLGIGLHVVTTDEYADLFQGFNLMTKGLREEGRMLEVTQDLSTELNLDVLIQRIMIAAAELMSAARSTLFLYDPKTNELWSSYAAGLETRQIRIPADSGIAGSVFTTGRIENIADPYADGRFNQEVDRKTGYRTTSILAAPIVAKGGGPIGVVEVLNKQGDSFSVKDEARLRAFAAQIAVLLKNAQLFDEVLSVKNYNENILRSTSNGLVTIDIEGRLVTANEAALSIIGLPADAVIGQSAGALFGADSPWLTAALHKVAATGERDVSVDANLTSPGGSVAVNMTVLPLLGVNKEGIGSMLVFEDITEEKRVKTTMARYMSKEVADQLLAGGEEELGGKSQTVSIMFSDIRHFTTLSEALGPRETVSMLNGYFSEMVDVIFEHNGILDKYIGDAIMALFGVPFNRPGDADNAVVVANQMMRKLRAHNRVRYAEGKEPIDIGVGICTGDVIVGNIGSPKRMEYTAIGDSVNLASRLEGANKAYATKILVSQSVIEAIKNPVPHREIDLIRVKGKDHPVAVHEILGYHDQETFPHLEEALEVFGQSLAAYRTQDWTGAIRLFTRVLDLQPGDGPSLMYIDRCRHYLQNAPSPDWGGVWIMTDK